MKEKFLSAIHTGNYHEAKELTQGMSTHDLTHFLLDQACEIDSVSIDIYTFVCFELIERETLSLHSRAAAILDFGMFFMEGAISGALSHSRRMAELAPHDISHKRALLFYFGRPDHVMSSEEAQSIAQEVLAIDPEETKALGTIEWITRPEEPEIFEGIAEEDSDE